MSEATALSEAMRLVDEIRKMNAEQAEAIRSGIQGFKIMIVGVGVLAFAAGFLLAWGTM